MGRWFNEAGRMTGGSVGVGIELQRQPFANHVSVIGPANHRFDEAHVWNKLWSNAWSLLFLLLGSPSRLYGEMSRRWLFLMPKISAEQFKLARPANLSALNAQA